jgi:uncharacterized membrane protein
MDTSSTKFPIPPVSTSSRINVGSTERIASLAGGALLTYLGLRKFSLSRLGLAATGGALLYRGLTGYCPVNAELGRDTSEMGRGTGPIEVETSLTVNQPRDEVYAFWRQLENLPRFMHHLAEVQERGEGRSHWVARVPKGAGRVEWDARIQSEEEGRRLTWRSVAGAAIDNAGEVRFQEAPGGRGTEIHARIIYRPPAGNVGQAVAQLFNPVFEQMVKEDIRRFKHVIEAGETPTSSRTSTEGASAAAT